MTILTYQNVECPVKGYFITLMANVVKGSERKEGENEKESKFREKQMD